LILVDKEMMEWW